MPKISAKFQRDHPQQMWAPNAGWVGKVKEFRQITRYISKTVQDRCIVSIKDE